MSAGRLVWQGAMEDLGAQQRVRVNVATAAPAAAARVLSERGLAEVVIADGGASAILGEAQPEEVVAALVAAGVGVRGFVVQRPNLEEVFVGLTGEGFDVSG
jgi:ABC-2 type transport system ATP-binding protein